MLRSAAACGMISAGHFSGIGVCPLEEVLFPKTDVRLERVGFTSEALVVVAVACGPPSRCPSCRARARRVHSGYERGLAERPLTGRKLQVTLRVCRFFSDRPSCKRRTFVEQVNGLSERHRRSSSTRGSGSTRSPPNSAAGPANGCVAGLRLAAGRTYGTVLVDVLPDRTSETFAALPRDHPGVEIICRDRATATPRAGKEAAPDTQEAADRRHLLRNLAAVVESVEACTIGRADAAFDQPGGRRGLRVPPRCSARARRGRARRAGR